LFDFNGFLNEHDLTFVPEANIIENGKDYQIELAVPGLERKDFKVEVENNTLIVSAEKEEEKKPKKKIIVGENFHTIRSAVPLVSLII
jgi:HSP20 family protein